MQASYHLLYTFVRTAKSTTTPAVLTNAPIGCAHSSSTFQHLLYLPGMFGVPLKPQPLSTTVNFKSIAPAKISMQCDEAAFSEFTDFFMAANVVASSWKYSAQFIPQRKQLMVTFILFPGKLGLSPRICIPGFLLYEKSDSFCKQFQYCTQNRSNEILLLTLVDKLGYGAVKRASDCSIKCQLSSLVKYIFDAL